MLVVHQQAKSSIGLHAEWAMKQFVASVSGKCFPTRSIECFCSREAVLTPMVWLCFQGMDGMDMDSSTGLEMG